ncbi:MAG TPA: multicopper oxidase domain-containing protein [Steroidobacteraceae bacterium]|nr:multicopper oxidase domain-containing protein [Steroidobacteraceae bacterium]
MKTRHWVRFGLPTVVLAMISLPAAAQSFRVQCPYSTITHPDPGAALSTPADTGVNSAEPAYIVPTTFTCTVAGGCAGSGAANAGTANAGYLIPATNTNGAIKCQQVSGGDGYSTMGDGTQTFMYSFGPLSGLAAIADGQPGTQFPDVFNTVYPRTFLPGDPATSDGQVGGGSYTQGAYLPGSALFSFNGAVGQMPDALCAAEPASCATNTPPTPTTGAYAYIDGHVDPRQIMDVGVMNGNIPAPLMAIDEDDEFFLTLTNVGMIMRPDLFEQHTIHFHGYPNASSVYDGVPDASVAINIGGSFTYYYLAPDAGTYFWHCHITPPEHLQMGMVGQLYVRPRQNRLSSGMSLFTALQIQNGVAPGQTVIDLRTACNPGSDPLCSTVTPTVNTGATQGAPRPVQTTGQTALTYATYVYNDGDGSTAYDTEFPIQIHGFDPNFHFVGMTFNPEGFVDMKDKYFLMNGRSYPDTVTPGPQATQSSDGKMHYSQPLPSIINIPFGGKALLRLSDLAVTEYATIASLGVPMHVVGYNAKLLRDQEGNNTDYYTNSITIGGGESADVILDASDAGCGSVGCAATQYPRGSVFYVYTPNLDHLSNDAENFGGLMTEVHIN